MTNSTYTVRTYLVNRIAEIWLYTAPEGEHRDIAEQYCQGPVSSSISKDLLDSYVYRFYQEKYSSWTTTELLGFFNELAAQGEVLEEEIEKLGEYVRPLNN